jgi:carboxylesterase
MYWRLNDRDMSSARLVLLHGLASTPKEFGLLVHPLRRLGVSLHTPEIRGYSHAGAVDGAAAAAPTRRAKWQDWVDDAAERVEAIAAESSAPFVLGGLCTGAMLAVAVAAKLAHPQMKGIALLSPLFAYDGWGLPWWYRLRHIAYALGIEQRFAMAERSPYGLKNERMRSMVRQQLQDGAVSISGPSRVSLQVVRESERLSRHARTSLRKLAHPMVVLHARHDEICRLRSVEAVLQKASHGSPDRVRTHVLENSFHMIPADNDRQDVARHLAHFVSTDLHGTRRPQGVDSIAS